MAQVIQDSRWVESSVEKNVERWCSTVVILWVLVEPPAYQTNAAAFNWFVGFFSLRERVGFVT